jgi:hypothetical protein
MLEAALRRVEGEYRRRQGQRDHLHYCAGVEIHALRAGGITGTVATALGVRGNRGPLGLLSRGFGARVRVFGRRAAVGRAGLIHDPVKTWGPRGHQRDQHQTTNDCVQPSRSLGLQNSLRGSFRVGRTYRLCYPGIWRTATGLNHAARNAMQAVMEQHTVGSCEA